MWRALAVSVIGTAHERAGLPCQDVSGVQVVSTPAGEVLVAVASDGAGSAPRAAAGAARVCEAVLSWAQRHLADDGGLSRLLDAAPEETARGLIEEIREAIAEEAKAANEPCEAFAATVLAACVAPERSLVVQLGDGAIVHRTSDDPAWRLALEGHRGEYANETVFVTSPQAAEVVQATVIAAPVTDVVLMTDGVAFLAVRAADGTPHAPFFDHVTAPFRAEAETWDETATREWLAMFLGSSPVNARTDDDKTLVIACRSARGDAAHREG